MKDEIEIGDTLESPKGTEWRVAEIVPLFPEHAPVYHLVSVRTNRSRFAKLREISHWKLVKGGN